MIETQENIPPHVIGERKIRTFDIIWLMRMRTPSSILAFGFRTN